MLTLPALALQHITRKDKHMNDVNLKRIADAMEEILRLVKLDQEASKKRWEYKPNEDGFMGSENRIESE